MLREFARNNIPVLRKNFVRMLCSYIKELQSSHIVYSCIVATQNTDKKTSKTGVFVFATSLMLCFVVFGGFFNVYGGKSLHFKRYPNFIC
jgi:hypothetical protein